MRPFTGQPMDVWYALMGLALIGYAGAIGVDYLQYVLIPVQAFLSWMVLRWIVANIAVGEQPPALSFNGSPWGYIGWYVLMILSAITIVGWAWVLTAWMRWICRNIDGTRRAIVYTASGWQMLWRTLVFAFGCSFLIPIPWLLRWYTRWYVAQFALAPRA